MKEIVKKKQEILVGSSKLESLKKRNFDKNNYFIENMAYNKYVAYATL